MKSTRKFGKNQDGIIKILLLIVLVLAGMSFILFFIGKSAGISSSYSTSTNSTMTSFDNSKNKSGGSTFASAPTNNLLSFLNINTSNSKSQSNTGYFGGSVLSIGTGNASYNIQPMSEYITIRNNSSASIDITGYVLTNNKGVRPIETTQNQNITNAVPDRVTIPQGTKYLSPDARYVLQDIILEPGGTAYVLTGGPFISYTVPISVSFQDNKCEGYLSKTYPFTPYLNYSCPRLEDETGAESVSIQCYDYLKSIYNCREPKKDDKFGYESQTTICQRFVDSVSNYKGCYANHVSDKDFLTKDWRIFLGRKQEMWASRNESIKLYDRAGKLVTQVSY